MPKTSYLDTLKKKGYKLTSQRRKIIEVLRQAGRRLAAREIHQRIRAELPAVSMDTVYRNLHLLCDVGLVHQISLSSGSVYELDADLCHHHHLICVDCEKVVCIEYCPDLQGYSEQAGRQGFDLIGHTFALQGRCSDCRQAKISPSPGLSQGERGNNNEPLH